MSETFEFYQQQAKSSVASLPWLAKLKSAALIDFKRLGFPTRRDEEWKYTSVDTFTQQQFNVAPVGDVVENPKRIVLDSFKVSVNIVNGKIAVSTQNLPTGVIVQSLAQAWVEHADKIKPYLNQILKHEHGFQALNTAMLDCGVFILLPEGVSLSEPLVLAHWNDNLQQATYLRHVVVAEKGSCATIIEDYDGEGAYAVNTITEVYTAQDAKVTHFKIQRESKLAYHMGHTAVKQQANSQFDSHLFSLGGKLVRSDLTISLDESHARCFMNGIYAPSHGQHMDHHTRVLHAVPDCSSVQDYKGILSGQSRAVFNGKVVVAKDAQHTSAAQQNKNLLLSLEAEIDTKPQLEIFANDVICTHGATVGQLDEEALFYLATRGIEHEEACQYLIQAFTIENLRVIAEPELAACINTLLMQQIGRV